VKKQPRENIIAFRVNDGEIELIDAVAEELNVDRSEALRTIIKFAFSVDPEKIKKYHKKVKFDVMSRTPR